MPLTAPRTTGEAARAGGSAATLAGPSGSAPAFVLVRATVALTSAWFCACALGLGRLRAGLRGEIRGEAARSDRLALALAANEYAGHIHEGDGALSQRRRSRRKIMREDRFTSPLRQRVSAEPMVDFAGKPQPSVCFPDHWEPYGKQGWAPAGCIGRLRSCSLQPRLPTMGDARCLHCAAAFRLRPARTAGDEPRHTLPPAFSRPCPVSRPPDV